MQLAYKILKSVNGSEVKNIYHSVGWDTDGELDIDILSQLAEKSFLFVGAFNEDNGQMIGMGRVLSDGISDACIQDIAVLKEYQGQGVGRKIMELLIKECKLAGIDWIQLIASKDGYKLYQSLGFQPMDDFIPMKLS